MSLARWADSMTHSSRFQARRGGWPPSRRRCRTLYTLRAAAIALIRRGAGEACGRWAEEGTVLARDSGP
jgi:hypothetical protein